LGFVGKRLRSTFSCTFCDALLREVGDKKLLRSFHIFALTAKNFYFFSSNKCTNKTASHCYETHCPRHESWAWH